MQIFLPLECNPRYIRNPIGLAYLTAQTVNIVFHYIVLFLLAIICSEGDSNASWVCVKPVVGLILLAICTCGCGVFGNGGVCILKSSDKGLTNLLNPFLIIGEIFFKFLLINPSSGIGLPSSSFIKRPLSSVL